MGLKPVQLYCVVVKLGVVGHLGLKRVLVLHIRYVIDGSVPAARRLSSYTDIKLYNDTAEVTLQKALLIIAIIIIITRFPLFY